MFKGQVLGVWYCSWHAYKKAWNEAVLAGKIFDNNGRKVTKIYQD